MDLPDDAENSVGGSRTDMFGKSSRCGDGECFLAISEARFCPHYSVISAIRGAELVLRWNAADWFAALLYMCQIFLCVVYMSIEQSFYYDACWCRQQSQLTVVGSPYWMAPECIMGLPYCEKVVFICV